MLVNNIMDNVPGHIATLVTDMRGSLTGDDEDTGTKNYADCQKLKRSCYRGDSLNEARSSNRASSRATHSEEDHDLKYLERRRRNNLAAKKSREARKLREDQVMLKMGHLEQENAILRAKVAVLREEMVALQIYLLQRIGQYHLFSNNSSSSAVPEPVSATSSSSRPNTPFLQDFSTCTSSSPAPGVVLSFPSFQFLTGLTTTTSQFSSETHTPTTFPILPSNNEGSSHHH